MSVLTECWLSVYRSVSCLVYAGGLGASDILGSLDHNKYLGKLISYLDPVLPSASRADFVRCWRAKTDGWAASTFHSNCDGKGPTVTIIKVNNYIFGGYTDVSWGGSKYTEITKNKNNSTQFYIISWYIYGWMVKTYLMASGAFWLIAVFLILLTHGYVVLPFQVVLARVGPQPVKLSSSHFTTPKDTILWKWHSIEISKTQCTGVILMVPFLALVVVMISTYPTTL